MEILPNNKLQKILLKQEIIVLTRVKIIVSVTLKMFQITNKCVILNKRFVQQKINRKLLTHYTKKFKQNQIRKNKFKTWPKAPNHNDQISNPLILKHQKREEKQITKQTFYLRNMIRIPDGVRKESIILQKN